MNSTTTRSQLTDIFLERTNGGRDRDLVMAFLTTVVLSVLYVLLLKNVIDDKSLDYILQTTYHKPNKI